MKGVKLQGSRYSCRNQAMPGIQRERESERKVGEGLKR